MSVTITPNANAIPISTLNKDVASGGLSLDNGASSIPKPTSPVTMVDTGSAVAKVNSQKSYLDSVAPPTPPAAKNDDGSGGPVNDQSGAGPGSDNTYHPPTPDTSTAEFVNAGGQTAKYTQTQLNDPTTQQFLKDNGYVLTNSNGLNVNSDFTIAGKQSDYNSSAKDVQDLTTKFLNYNVNQDPDFQLQATNIMNSYNQLIDAMKVTNASRTAGMTTMGMREGTAQYANDIAGGAVTEEMRQGDARIADLVTKENAAISAARQSFQSNNYSTFNAQVNALKDIRDQKAKTLTDYNKAIQDATKAVTAQNNDSGKAITDLKNIAATGADLTPDQIAKYDKMLGGDGSAASIYKAAKQTASDAADLKFAQSLAKLPPGSTVNRNGNTYTSTQIGKLTKVTEKAKDGTFTTVFYNADGTVHSSTQGTAGDGSSGSGGGTTKKTPEQKKYEGDVARARQALAGGKSWGSQWNYLHNQYPGISNDMLDQILNKDEYYKQ